MMAARNKTFCPPQARRFDNYCYCNSEDKYKFPTYCDVECLNKNFPDNTLLYGGCQCPGFLGGARCERTLCHFTPSKFYDPKHYRLFCLDGYDFSRNHTDTKSIRVDEDCNGVVNRAHPAQPASYYPVCPCFNNGYRLEDPTDGNTTCQCVKGYTGNLCQTAPSFSRPSPLPTIGVIAFLTAAFFVIGLALWRRKRQNMKLYAKMYQLDPVDHTTSVSTPTAVFAPTKLPGQSPSDGPSPDSTTPRPLDKSRRKSTLSALFSGRHNQPQQHRRPASKKKPTKKAVPTVYEGQELGTGQQQPTPAYEGQFGLEPQYQSSGMT